MKITLKVINDLVEKLNQDISTCESSQDNQIVFGYFERTLNYIKKLNA
jgi:hypothetical protein